MSLNSQSQSYLDRLKVGVSSTVDLDRLAYWIEQNTTHPKDSLKNWSWAGHEYQVDILNDPASRVVVRKCSQVGVSELVVRLVLALMGTLRNTTAIYTLPTTGFASKFTKSRVDPVISNSAVLRELLNKDVDNVELKQIGSNFLYFLGTFTQKAAISIPADILINDEVDFSNQQALTTFASRLGHAEGRELRREFSTPTRNGFGISESFDISSQAHYGVRCDNCHELVFPQFMEDVVIPGFNDKLEDFEKEDLHDTRYDILNAFLLCPECQAPINNSALLAPEKREWVHKYPDRGIRGYQVFPYDVPSINPIHKTLTQLGEYNKKADWVNFKVGLPYEDAESSFLREVLNNSKTVAPTPPPFDRDGLDLPKYTHKGFVMGVDVGKTSWVLIGKPVSRTRIEVVWAERIRQDGDGGLLSRLLFLVKWFGVSKGVIDAGPDFTTSMAFVEAFPLGRTFANYYTRAKPKNTLSHISVNEAEGVLSTVRTESLDLLAKKVNAGQYGLPKMAETELVIAHLSNLKRIETENNQGDMVANWTNTGADHYAHALNYMNIAATLLDSRFSATAITGVLPMAAKVRVRTQKGVEGG